MAVAALMWIVAQHIHENHVRHFLGRSLVMKIGIQMSTVQQVLIQFLVEIQALVDCFQDSISSTIHLVVLNITDVVEQESGCLVYSQSWLPSMRMLCVGGAASGSSPELHEAAVHHSRFKIWHVNELQVVECEIVYDREWISQSGGGRLKLP
jgi:hypothetical protein